MIYTVIGYYEDSGQIFAHHTEADSGMDAFRQCALREDMNDNALFVVAVEGMHEEGETTDFPGESVVDAMTVLDQPTVFGGE